MTRTITVLAILATLIALLAAPAVAQSTFARVIVQGEVQSVQVVYTATESIGTPDVAHRRGSIRVKVGAQVVTLLAEVEILDGVPERAAIVHNGDGTAYRVAPGQSVRVVATFANLTPGDGSPTVLSVRRVGPAE